MLSGNPSPPGSHWSTLPPATNLPLQLTDKPMSTRPCPLIWLENPLLSVGSTLPLALPPRSSCLAASGGVTLSRGPSTAHGVPRSWSHLESSRDPGVCAQQRPWPRTLSPLNGAHPVHVRGADPRPPSVPTCPGAASPCPAQLRPPRGGKGGQPAPQDLLALPEAVLGRRVTHQFILGQWQAHFTLNSTPRGCV